MGLSRDNARILLRDDTTVLGDDRTVLGDGRTVGR